MIVLDGEPMPPIMKKEEGSIYEDQEHHRASEIL